MVFVSFPSLATLVLLVSPAVLCMNCSIKPAPLVVDTATAWAAVLFGCPVVPILVEELHGKANLNAAKLTIPAGQGFPPHRHNGSEEYIFFTAGSGDVTILELGKTKETLAVKAGDFHFLPAWGIHDVRASATEDLSMIVMTSPAPFVIETFEAWPESTDVPVGKVSTILGFIPECPPGQELPHQEL